MGLFNPENAVLDIPPGIPGQRTPKEGNSCYAEKIDHSSVKL
jgi:hypothetical protein